MKKPLCRLCQTHHYSHEPHNFPATDEAPQDEVAVVEKRRVDDAPKKERPGVSRSVIVERVKAGTISDAAAGVALTLAERSARHRAKKIASDPDWLKREAARQKRYRDRQKIRGSPSE